MLNYAKIKDKPCLLRSFTGLHPRAFAKLLESFDKAYQPVSPPVLKWTETTE